MKTTVRLLEGGEPADVQTHDNATVLTIPDNDENHDGSEDTDSGVN